MSDAINPVERDGCWLCDGCGEVEAVKASTGQPETVGCPACVENDHRWLLAEKQRECDALATWKKQHEAAQTNIAGRYWEDRCREAEAERDALAAHVERINSAGHALYYELEQWSLTEGDPESVAAMKLWRLARGETPATSLARRQAEEEDA